MADSDPFEQFMEAYQGMVFSISVRLVGNEADALDVAQEVFLKAHQHFEGLQTSPSAGGWLKKVTRNCALNHLTRYRARWRFFSEMFSIEHADQLDALLPVSDGRDGRDEVQHRRFYLEQALEKLPDSQRVPLVLYHFEELSYEEIARQLHVSLSKVKTDIHRARQSLRRWLRPDLEEGGRRTKDSEPETGNGGAPGNLLLRPRLAGGM